MQSPGTSRRALREVEVLSSKPYFSPSREKINLEECPLYYLHKESSPNFRCGQDVLEIGWGDSPEPLNIEKKSTLLNTPINCKKKLETKESPKSSMPSKRRNIRSTLRVSSNSLVDIAKYVAEVQELSKNIMQELNDNKTEKGSNQDICLSGNNKFFHNNVENIEPSLLENQPIGISASFSENCNSQKKDPNFDNVLQSFIDEEDDWLSQALCDQECNKTPTKFGFVKCKSENELSLHQQNNVETNKNLGGKSLNNNFRRTSSFDMTKSQSNITNKNYKVKKLNENECKPTGFCKTMIVQYSEQEIEKKRLEAIYRRERKEIERKKMEAMKRLEMKKLRTIKTL